MIEQGDSVPIEHEHESPRATSYGLAPQFGDPALELFGHGWNPAQDSATTSTDTYTGRHRAPEV